jgi:transcription antitermination factor NusB
MRKRTVAREASLKIFYQLDMRGEDLGVLISEYFEENKLDPEIRQYTELLVRGAFQHRDEIESIIKKHAVNWDLNRMAVLDRLLLQSATFELLYLPDIPPKVVINEAVNIAKKYSQEKSGKFVNGILDKIHHEEKRRPFKADLNAS